MERRRAQKTQPPTMTPERTSTAMTSLAENSDLESDLDSELGEMSSGIHSTDTPSRPTASNSDKRTKASTSGNRPTASTSGNEPTPSTSGTEPTPAKLVDDTSIAWDAVRDGITDKLFCLSEIHKSRVGMALLVEAMKTKPCENMIKALNPAYSKEFKKTKPIGGKVEARRANLREMVCTLDYEDYVKEFQKFMDTEEGDSWFHKLVDKACDNTALRRAPKFGKREYIRLLHVLNEPSLAYALKSITQPRSRNDIEVEQVNAWGVFTERFNDTSYAPKHITIDTNNFETCGENGHTTKVHERDARQLKKHYGTLKTDFSKYYHNWSASGQSDGYGDQKDFRMDFLEYRNALTEEMVDVYEYMFYFLKDSPNLDMFHRGVPEALQESASASGSLLGNDADVERRRTNRNNNKRKLTNHDDILEKMSRHLDNTSTPVSSMCNEEKSNLAEQTLYFKSQSKREKNADRREENADARERERLLIEKRREAREEERNKMEIDFQQERLKIEKERHEKELRDDNRKQLHEELDILNKMMQSPSYSKAELSRIEKKRKELLDALLA